MSEDEIKTTDIRNQTEPLGQMEEIPQQHTAIKKAFHYFALEMKNESGELSAEEEEELCRQRTQWMTDAKEALVHYKKGWNDFSGKSGRSEFWWSTLIVSAIGVCLSWIFAPLGSFWALGTLLPTLAVCVRRLNDVGRSWKSLFWLFVPLVGPILLLVWMTKKGVPDQVEGRISHPQEPSAKTPEATGKAPQTAEDASETEGISPEKTETPPLEWGWGDTYGENWNKDYGDPFTNWLNKKMRGMDLVNLC